jgi:hypothetical protein
MGDLFTPPAPENPVDLLPDAPYKDELGLGLFGSLRMVSTRVTLAPGVLAAVEDAATGFVPAAEGSPEVVTVPTARDGAGLRLRATVQQSVRTRPVFVGIEEEL